MAQDKQTNGDQSEQPEQKGADLHDYRSAPTHPISKRTDGSSKEHHTPHANTEEYERMYKESIEDPTGFWDKVSRLQNRAEQAGLSNVFPRDGSETVRCSTAGGPKGRSWIFTR